MPSSDPQHQTAGPTSAEVLAAVDRAVRHPPRPGASASTAAVLAHLGLSSRSAAARRTRASLSRLEAVGMLASSRAHGRTSWRPGPRGRARLRALRSAGMAPALPESPQHRAWREARAAARARIGVFRVQLADAARELETLAARDPPPASDALLALGAGVADRARRLASAVHCLHEWHEPDDAHADVDTIDQPAAPAAALGAASLLTASRLGALRAGRRNVRLWDEAV